jgi:glycosyltransferase involved in cell wall biosynthesis
MKLLITADTVGGVWTYALELVDALAAGHGVEVVLAVTGAPLTADQRLELRRSRVSRAYAKPYALEWMDEPWRDLARTARWLMRIREQVEPDVVHLNGYAHAALPWDAPTLVVGHSCVLSWHEAVRGRPAGPEWARYYKAVRTGLAAADLLVAPTRAMLDDLVRLYGPACPRLVVPNGRHAAHRHVGKQKLVLAAGRLWDEGKNVGALTRVAARLDWPVAVAGEGRVCEGVVALGRLGREELDAILARAAIFAAPARYEPFGLAPLEAGLAGCALVLGDIPSLREVWGDAALFVPPGDDAALEWALEALIRDNRQRNELARRARHRAASYTPERMAAGYLAAYEQVSALSPVEAAP